MRRRGRPGQDREADPWSRRRRCTPSRLAYSFLYHDLGGRINSLFAGPTQKAKRAEERAAWLGSFDRPGIVRGNTDELVRLHCIWQSFGDFHSTAPAQFEIGHADEGHAARLTARQADRYQIGP